MSINSSAEASLELREQHRRIGRFTIAVSTALLLAVVIEWPLSIVAPIFAAMFLGPPGEPLPGSAYLGIIVAAITGLSVGLFVVWLILPFMALTLLVMTLLLFGVFYHAQRGLNPLLVLMLMLGLMLIPALGLISRSLAFDFSFGFVASLAVGLGLCALAYSLFPPLRVATQNNKASATPVPASQAIRQALLSTLLVLPLLLYFYIEGNTSDLLILIIVAILAPNLDLKGGLLAGAVMIIANLLGGLAASLFYSLLVAVPTLPFFALGLLVVALAFATAMFTSAKSKVYASAFTTFLVLIGSMTASHGGEADAKFIVRLVQVSCAVIYISGGAMLFQLLGLTVAAKPTTEQKAA